MKLTGHPQKRQEDPRFLTGQARYLADIHANHEAWIHIVRAPHAHASLGPIQTAAASAMPGVLGVFTAADLAPLGPIPCNVKVASDHPMIVPPRTVLAAGRVRHVGEPVAFVAAATRVQAQDAAEAVEVEYGTLPCVTEAADALAPGAPQLWDEAPGNLAYVFRKGDAAAVAQGMAAAAHVVELTLVNNRLIIAPLEHRAALGEYAGSAYTLLLSGQGVHAIRNDLLEVMRLQPDQLRVVTPDVGGGFGVKNGVYPEYAMVLWAAKRLARPVRWESGHGEDFVSTAHGRDNRTTARLGLDAQGRFLALEVHTDANLGAAMATGGPGSSTNAPGNAMGAGYAIPAVCMTVRGAFTNTVPLDAYRGAGKPEANYIIERLVEEAARTLGHDRVELRRRNLVHAFPHRTAIATTIDCGRFAQNIDPALEAADAPGFPARRAAAAAAGRLRGLGIACFLETARGAPGEGAEVRFAPEGRVQLLLGTHSNGQGHETSFPQIAADRLGLPIDAFDYIQGDTASVRDGNGHGGARSLHMGGTALVGAIEGALAKGRAAAARMLQAEHVTFADGLFTAGDRTVGLLEVARAAAADPALGGPLDTHHWTPLDLITFPNGVHVAEVEVDPETGAVALLRYTGVDDFGAAVNPLLLEGQMQGGLAQGIGQALTERTVYDPETGQLLTGSFMDYCLPRAADLPRLDLHLRGEPTTANPLGVKGAGQAGAIAAPQTIVLAVLDALTPLNITHLDMPLTPERLWTAIQTAKEKTPK